MLDQGCLFFVSCVCVQHREMSSFSLGGGGGRWASFCVDCHKWNGNQVNAWSRMFFFVICVFMYARVASRNVFFFLRGVAGKFLRDPHKWYRNRVNAWSWMFIVLSYVCTRCVHACVCVASGNVLFFLGGRWVSFCAILISKMKIM